MFRSTSTDTTVTFTFDMIRQRTVKVRGDLTLEVDLADASEEGVRFLLTEGLTKVIGNTAAGMANEPDAKVLARAADKWAQLRGEKDLRTRGASMTEGLKGFRRAIIAAAKRDRIKLPKLPDTWDGVEAIAITAGYAKAKVRKVRKQHEQTDDVAL